MLPAMGTELAAAGVFPVAAGQQDVGSQQVYSRFLVSNVAAGAIIGKNGQTVTQVQEESGCRIQLSRNLDATNSMSAFRVLLLHGSLTSCVTAVNLMLSRVLNSGAPSQTILARDGVSTLMRMLVPSPLVGSIIGTGGATMQHLRSTTGAAITVSPLRKQPPIPADRVVTIVGSKDALVAALDLLLRCLRSNEKYELYTPQRLPESTANTMGLLASTSPLMAAAAAAAAASQPGSAANLFGGAAGPSGQYMLPATGGLLPAFTPALMHGGLLGGATGTPDASIGTTLAAPVAALASQPAAQQQMVETSFSVPDARVGAIIGRRGEVIVKIQQLLNVKVFVSSRSERPTPDSERVVTISGTPEAVQLAQQLLQQKLRGNMPGF